MWQYFTPQTGNITCNQINTSLNNNPPTDFIHLYCVCNYLPCEERLRGQNACPNQPPDGNHGDIKVPGHSGFHGPLNTGIPAHPLQHGQQHLDLSLKMLDGTAQGLIYCYYISLLILSIYFTLKVHIHASFITSNV